MNDSIPIRYLGFWDVPRNFLVQFEGELYLFDCPFDETIEDYPEFYSVYVLPDLTREEIDEDWVGLPTKAVRKVGSVPIAAIRFDPTKRKEIGSEIFDLLASNAPSANGTAVHAETPARIS